MEERVKQKVEKIFDEGEVGYAYYYPKDGTAGQVFVFSMTPENIANFLGEHFLDARKIVLTDMLDRLILDTNGGFIDRCPNQQLCMDVNHFLVPIQLGDMKPKKFTSVTQEEFEAYGRWEDEMITRIEISMM